MKIIEDIKRTEHKRKDKERIQGKARRDASPSGFVQCLKKWARPNRPLRTEASVAFNVVACFVDYGRRHPRECWTKSGACL